MRHRRHCRLRTAWLHSLCNVMLQTGQQKNASSSDGAFFLGGNVKFAGDAQQGIENPENSWP
ncbi:hypothetical protein EMIT0P100_170039 [Pseudomonas sp. IT-P100]